MVNKKLGIIRGEGLSGAYFKGLIWNEPPPLSIAEESMPAKPILFDEVTTNFTSLWGAKTTPVSEAFSAVWSGYLYIPVEGKYAFSTEADDGSALYVDHTLVVTNWGRHAATIERGAIHLKKGYVPITIWYYNEVFGGFFSLRWKPPEQPEGSIDPEYFHTVIPTKER